MAKNGDSSVAGIFAHRSEASQAVQALEARAFRDSDISLLMSDAVGKDFKIENTSKVAEGPAAGATSGGLIGALVGGLTAVGTIATGGGLLVARPLVAILAGGGAGAGLGGLIGELAGTGMTEYEAKLFAQELEDGKILIAVHCTDDVKRQMAEQVLESAGGTVSVTT